MTTIGRWSPNKVRSKIIDAEWVSETRYGFELVKPSSVDKAGTGSTATSTMLGSVEFTVCTSLSLNGVFSSEYNNYMLVVRYVSSGSSAAVIRLRSGGVDNSTASSYTRQILQANNTVVDASRFIDNFGGGLELTGDQYSGASLYFYGPNLTQPTVWRFASIVGVSSAKIADVASVHNQSTSYDGLTFVCLAGTFSGRVAVYGMRG
jgi:hypothetical protein